MRRPRPFALVVLAVALVTFGCTTAPVDGASGSTSVDVVGTVRTAPSCPVEVPGSPCPARPLVGALVEILRGGDRVATTRTDEHGRYGVRVPAGDYVVRASTANALPVPAEVRVSVPAAGPVDLLLDSGIRRPLR